MENKRKRKDDLESEIVARQNSIAKFEKSRPFTGSINNDIGTLLATREDRRAIASARNSLDAESQIAAQMRGQDIQKELGLGTTKATLRGQDIEKEIEMRKAAVIEKGYQQNFDVGMGELGLNKDIFKATQDRYKEFGRPFDEMNFTERYAEVKKGLEDIGFDAPILEKYEGKYGKSVAKPAAGVLGQQATQQNPVGIENAIPFAGYAPYPQVLEAAPITHYGKGILPQIGGSAVEGIKLLGRTAARLNALDPLSPTYRYKRKVKK